MSDWYDELGEIMGTLDAYETELECMILMERTKKQTIILMKLRQKSNRHALIFRMLFLNFPQAIR